MIAGYPSPVGGEEYAVSFAHDRTQRLLVLPALFDEGNKLRHFTLEVMRELDRAGIDTFLPDLPGCNESLSPLEQQTLVSWQGAADAAAAHFSATAVLSIRAGALCEPPGLPAVRYAAVAGSSSLRGLVRARIIASKEAGRAERSEELLEHGRSNGLELAGYRLGPQMTRDLEAAVPKSGTVLAEIGQEDLGGPGLWLRAEPDHSAEQATKLAALVIAALS